MRSLKRREFLKTSSGVAAAAAGPFIWVKDASAQWSNTPEKGAKLRVLRWKRFVQGDEDQYMANVKKFSEKFGIEVRVETESILYRTLWLFGLMVVLVVALFAAIITWVLRKGREREQAAAP